MDSSRTELLIGVDKAKRLSQASVLVVGLGGVGSYTVEALARAGIGRLTLVDEDIVSASNCNRQLFALSSTVGLSKTEVAKKRVLDINPDCTVDSKQLTVMKENAEEIVADGYDYVVDAIDTVTAKLALMAAARKKGLRIVSCMGTGNKLHADFSVADVHKTTGCPLARAVRKLCREQGIADVKVVYTPQSVVGGVEEINSRHAPGSISYVPAMAGLKLAETVICDLLEEV